MSLVALFRDETRRISALQIIRNQRIVNRVAHKLGLRGEVGVTFVDDRNMSKFNHGPTDVLAFPYEGNGLYIGDIFINVDYLSRTRKQRDKVKRGEELLVHALLHLKGYTHDDYRSYTTMRQTEARVLGRPCLPAWKQVD